MSAADPDRAGERDQLLRLRRLVVSVLALAVALSLAANVLAAQPSVIGRAVAAWPPLALIITTDLISRVPAHRRGLGVARQGAALLIAGIAGWLSYGHMVTVAERAGAGPAAAHVLPLTVDGMAVVASLCLVEIGTRLRAATATPATATPATATTAAPGRATPSRATPSRASSGRATSGRTSSTRATGPAPGPGPAGPERLDQVGAQLVPASATGEVVRSLAVEHPGWTQARLAQEAGCSVRTVRRHLVQPPSTQGADGAPVTHVHPTTTTPETDTGSTDTDSEAAA